MPDPPQSSQKENRDQVGQPDLLEKPTLKENPHYNCEDADLVMLSSDNVRYHVESFYLRAASAVWRDMLKTCGSEAEKGGREIDLVDRDLEASEVLTLFFDMTCDRPRPDLDQLDIPLVLRLIRLAQKYDCAGVLSNLRLYVNQPLDKLSGSPGNALKRFFWACQLDDAEAASFFFEGAAVKKWGAGDTVGSVHYCVPGTFCLDPSSMGSAFIDLLPRKYFLGLLRAWRVFGSGTAVAAKDFLKHVKLQEGGTTDVQASLDQAGTIPA